MNLAEKLVTRPIGALVSSARRSGCHIGTTLKPQPMRRFFVTPHRCIAIISRFGISSVPPAGNGARRSRTCCSRAHPSQLLLGHTKLESTVRYLGIEVDDALSISEQVEL